MQVLQFFLYITRSFTCQQRTEGSSKLPFLVWGRASLIQPSEEPTERDYCKISLQAQGGVFPKAPRRTWKHYPGNGRKFPRATSSVRSSQNKALEATSLTFFPAQPLLQADTRQVTEHALFASSLYTGEGVTALLCFRKSTDENHKGKVFHPLLNCNVCPAATRNVLSYT